MADRVAAGRIIAGHGDSRVVINPGERFNTDTIGISAQDVRKMEANGVIRRPRDPTMRATPAAGPRAATDEPVEGRSGDVQGDARSPAALETDQPSGDGAEVTESRRVGGRRKAAADDEL